MKKIFTFLILCAFFLPALLACGPNIHSAYYSSPGGGGYYKQVIGITCPHCQRRGTLSWAQYNSHEEAKCYYCGRMMNIKQSCAAFKYDTDRENREAFLKGLNDAANAFSNSVRSSSSGCEYKTFTTYVDGRMLFCTRYRNCDVDCY